MSENAAPDSVEYVLVDVFARRRYEGNQLAVVLDADRLSTWQMQQIARELNLSETTFPVARTSADESAGADYRVRIFTAGTELPFAGHPTLGTAWVLADRGRIGRGPRVQACGAGPIGVDLPAEPDGKVELQATPRDLTDPLSEQAVHDCLTAVGLDDDDLAGPVVAAGCGLSFVYLHVRPEALARSRMRFEPMEHVDLAGQSLRDPLIAVDVFCVEPGPDRLQVRSRVFVPGPSVPEDPATGSAAVGLGVAMVATGTAQADGVTRYDITQGVEMGRPSFLSGRVEASAGVARSCWVGGHVLAVGGGRLRVPDER